MKVTTEEAAGAMITKTEGRVDSSNARAFDDALRATFGEGDHPVIVDCEELTYVSSAGLRVVLLAAKTLQQQNRKFKICSLTNSIRDLFEISGFDKIIDVYPDRSAALASLEN